MLRVVAQWGCYGVVRNHLVMTFPGRISVFHRPPIICGLPSLAIHQTRIILPKMAEQIHLHPLQAYLKVRREHRRACPQIRAKVLRAIIPTGVHLRVPSRATRPQHRQIQVPAAISLTFRLQILPIQLTALFSTWFMLQAGTIHEAAIIAPSKTKFTNPHRIK